MSSDALRSELLAARDRRQERIAAGLASGAPSVIALSLNIPGGDKVPPGGKLLFAWGLKRLGEVLPLRRFIEETDRLGPFAVLLCDASPLQAKRAAVPLEQTSPAGRLLDLDVYGRGGTPLGRRELGLPPRLCLLCDASAVECMRLRRHDTRHLRARTDELLRPFAS